MMTPAVRLIAATAPLKPLVWFPEPNRFSLHVGPIEGLVSAQTIVGRYTVGCESNARQWLWSRPGQHKAIPADSEESAYGAAWADYEARVRSALEPREPVTPDAEYGALVGQLRNVQEHDWRVSHLAHTSDTASEAASAIEALIRERDEARETFSAYVETSQYAETVAFARATKAEACIAEVIRERDRLENGWGLQRGEVQSLAGELEREHERLMAAEARIAELEAGLRDLIVRAVPLATGNEGYNGHAESELTQSIARARALLTPEAGDDHPKKTGE